MTPIQNKIKARIAELGHTQTSLAEHLGTTRNVVNRAILHRHIHPTLKRVLDALGLELTVQVKEGK